MIEPTEAETEATFLILHPKFFHNSKTSVLTGRSTAETIEGDRTLLRETREWLKSQPDNVVAAYEYWLKHYEEQCDEAAEALLHLDETKEFARDYPKPTGVMA
jgi:hypothetical protein